MATIWRRLLSSNHSRHGSHVGAPPCNANPKYPVGAVPPQFLIRHQVDRCMEKGKILATIADNYSKAAHFYCTHRHASIAGTLEWRNTLKIQLISIWL